MAKEGKEQVDQSVPTPSRPSSPGEVKTEKSEKPKKKGLVFVVVLAIIVAGFMFGKKEEFKGPLEAQVTIIHNPCQIPRTTVLDTTFVVTLDASTPFYAAEVPFLLQPNDYIWFSGWTGIAEWDPDVKKKSARKVSPAGASWTPDAVPRSGDFKARHAPIASLIGVIGEYGWDDGFNGFNVPIVTGTNHFPIGMSQIVQTPIGGTCYLLMNERFVHGAWNDNSGKWHGRVKVIRPAT